MKPIVKPSPNFNSRDGHGIDMLVLHYTGMKTGHGAIEKLCDANAKVSAHYVVEEDGRIFQLVAEEDRAWHAGVSYWRGHTNINQRSVGIEIVNPGHEYGYRDFPAVQMKSVAELCQQIIQRHAIEPHNVVGHSDIAPTRKQDPGERFDWHWLAEQEIGLFPHLGSKEAEAAQLADYGYDITDLSAAIVAFQRHFRQNNLSGQWDKECGQLLKSLLDAS